MGDHHYEVKMNDIRIYTFTSTKLNEDQLTSFDFTVEEYEPQFIPKELPSNPLSNRPQLPPNPYE
jgi:hypothetical protein